MLVQGVAATNARVDIRLSVLGEVQLHRALAGRIRDVSDFSRPFRQIADDLVDMQQEAFAAQGGYEGNPAWAPLSARYAAWKARKFPGARILERTGKLRDLMVSPRVDIEPLRLRLAFTGYRVGRWDLPALHQTGTRRMPARKPLNLSARRKRRWTRFISKHLRIEGTVE